MSSTVTGGDGKERCRWCSAAPEFIDYHDKEWGYPVDDDNWVLPRYCGHF